MQRRAQRPSNLGELGRGAEDIREHWHSRHKGTKLVLQQAIGHQSRSQQENALGVSFCAALIVVTFISSHFFALQVLDCVENVPPDTLLGVWRELSAASEQLRLLMTTRSLFATQDLEDVATTIEIRRLSRRASIDLLRNIVRVSGS